VVTGSSWTAAAAAGSPADRRPVQQIAEGARRFSRGEAESADRALDRTDEMRAASPPPSINMGGQLFQQAHGAWKEGTRGGLRRALRGDGRPPRGYTDKSSRNRSPKRLVTIDLDGPCSSRSNPDAELGSPGSFRGGGGGALRHRAFAHTPELSDLLTETLAPVAAPIANLP